MTQEAPVFDQINGLPVHVLVVHAAVVFVPLLAAAAIVYALVRRWRSRIGWAVVLLAVAAPLASLVAKLSGDKLHQRLLDQGISGRGAEIINDHSGLGTLTLYFSLALGIVSLIMVFATLRARALPRAAELGVAVVVVALGAISGYYVFQTGDSGATAVWGTY
jgi:glucan phosphoethanolaminetransferase (alkaline phosphatase superfamily)